MFLIGVTNTVAKQVKTIFTDETEWFPYKIWEVHSDTSKHVETRICQDIQQKFINQYCKSTGDLDGLEDVTCCFIKAPKERIEALKHAIAAQIESTEAKGDESINDTDAVQLRQYAASLRMANGSDVNDNQPTYTFKVHSADIDGDNDHSYMCIFAHAHMRQIVAEDIGYEQRGLDNV